MDVAKKKKTIKPSFLKWFVDEQVEEEENAESNIRKYEMVGQGYTHA